MRNCILKLSEVENFNCRTATPGKHPSESLLKLKGEALNDTTVLLSLSASSGALDEGDFKICYGVYAHQDKFSCPQWLLLDLLARCFKMFLSLYIR